MSDSTEGRRPAEGLERSGPRHGQEFDYLLFSDVHLGSDIVPHLRPWAATSWLTREADIDAHVVGLVERARRERHPTRPWCLVLAGDFLDLVGVSLPPSRERMRTTPTEEEERHGLGSAPDHVVEKVKAIAARHPRVMQALCAFLGDGHSLVVVRGNHDIELHWRAAQAALVEAIVVHAPEAEREARAQRITICPWFFSVKGLLHVEHGHEFDAMCGYGDPLVPTCPRDSRRIRHTPFSVLLRNVARPTKGLSTSAYSYVSFGAYVRLLVRLGVRGTAGIAVRFTEASARLMREAWHHGRHPGRLRALIARARFRRFAATMGVREEDLDALRALYVKPAVQSLNFVIRSLYIDRIAASLFTAFFLSVTLLATLFASTLGAALSGLCAALMLGYACIGLERGLEPEGRMRDGATQIARMFGARWVVMGHTHKPQMIPLEGGATYVNLGYWGEDDLPDERAGAHAPPCTFLTLREIDGEFRAEFGSYEPEARTAQAGVAPPEDTSITRAA